MDEQQSAVMHNKKSILLQKISVWVLLALVLLTPVFFLPGTPISLPFGTNLLFAAGVILSIILLSVSTILEGSVEAPTSVLNPLALFVAVPVVYLLAAVFTGMTRMKFLGYTLDQSTVGFMLLAFLYMFLVFYLFRNKGKIVYSYIAFFAASLLTALFLVSRFIFGAGFLSFGIFSSLTSTIIGSWTSVGIFFGISTILSLLSLEMLSLTKIMKALISLVLLVSLFFLILVNFQLIWIVLIVFSIFFILQKIFFTKMPANSEWSDQIKKIPLFSSVVLCVSLIVLFLPIGQRLSSAMNISSVEVRPGVQITYDIFTQAIKSNPLFGSGPNTFQLEWIAHKPADVNTTTFWNTDFTYGVGLIPTFAATTGLLGLASWLLFLGVYLTLGIKSVFAKTKEMFGRYILTSSFFVSLYLWIMAVVYVPSGLMLILTFFFTGIFLASLRNENVMETKSISFSLHPKLGFTLMFAMIALIAASLALGYVLFNNTIAVTYFQKSLTAGNTSGNLVSAEAYIDKAIAAAPYDVYYRTKTEIEMKTISNLLSQDMSKTDMAAVGAAFTKSFTASIAAAKGAKDADPTNYLNWLELGKAYEFGVPKQTLVQGAYESAQAAYTQAQKINPQNPAINLAFANLEANKGNSTNIQKYIDAALKQKPNYTDAYFLEARIQLAGNNTQGAITAMTNASGADPNNPNVYYQLGLLQYNQKAFASAVTNFKKAIQLAPDYSNAKYFLGLSYAQLKDYASAVPLFEDLAKANPDNKDIASILKSLKENQSPFTSSSSNATTTASTSTPAKAGQ